MTDQEQDAGADPEQAHGIERGVGKFFGQAILWTRWLQIPLLAGMVLALLAFEISFFVHLMSAFTADSEFTRVKSILLILDLIDMVLIANLVVMVVISGYKIFIYPMNLRDEPLVPDWLKGLSLAGVKFRISATVLLITTIHLLHEFLDPSVESISAAAILLSAQLVLIATCAFAWIERIEAGH